MFSKLLRGHRPCIYTTILYLLSHQATAQISGQVQQSVVRLNVASVPTTAFQVGLSKWRHSTFVRLDKSALGQPAFITFDEHGNLLTSTTLMIPNTDRVYIKDFDVGADRSIVACGDAYSTSGQVAYFIARISADGNNLKISRTTPYWPRLITVAPDNTIWTIGIEEIIGSDGHAHNYRASANSLRHFDANGLLLGSGIPGNGAHITQLTSGYLVSAPDRIGWYAPVNGLGRYIEIALDGTKMGEYPGMPGTVDGPDQVTGFAITDVDGVFLTQDTVHPKMRTLYTLDRYKGTWTSLNGLFPMPTMPMLKGAQGKALVLAGPDGRSVTINNIPGPQ